MMEQILGPMRLGLVLFLSMFAFDESVRVSYVEREIVLERLHACPKKDIDREQVLQTYFREAGCTGSAFTLDQPQHSKWATWCVRCQALLTSKYLLARTSITP